MKAICTLFLTFSTLYLPILAQTALNRDFFSIPKAIILQKYIGNDIGDVLIDASGNGISWDFTNMEIEQLDIMYEFEQFIDTGSSFSNNTFIVSEKEGGSYSSAFELYSITDGLLLLRGFGTIDDVGQRNQIIFSKPFRKMRFPWILGETFYEEHPYKTSKRTLNASGTLILPGESEKSAFKFTEIFEDGETFYEEHSWYIYGLPFPVLTIKDQFLSDDSTLIMRSIELLKPKDITSLNEHYDRNKGLRPFLFNEVLNIPTGYVLKDIFNIHGSKVSYSELSSGQYSVQHSSQTLFIVYLDATQKIHSHIIPVIQ